MVGELSLPLRSHVASAMDGGKGEVALSALGVASNLLSAIGVHDIVRSPGVSDFPSELSDPLEGAEGGH